MDGKRKIRGQGDKDGLVKLVWGIGCDCSSVIKADPAKVISEHGFGGGEGMSHVSITRKSVPG